MKIVREQREENNSLLKVTVGEEDYGQMNGDFFGGRVLLHLDLGNRTHQIGSIRLRRDKVAQ